eukprot:GHUV01021377.1.p1 GENE.GHUV01021377.1~~GHUV01021377.1.p1  ORF type:complete len:290 (+),score=84.45 GHUV01021377.1:124-993(+)
MATLDVQLHFGDGLKDTQVMGKQDPYCVLQVGPSTCKSRTCTDGGTKPVWNETFRFNNVEYSSELIITIKNENVLADDVIGAARVPLQRVQQAGTESGAFPVMTPAGQQKGIVQITLTYRGPQHQQGGYPSAPQASGYPGGYPGQATGYPSSYPPQQQHQQPTGYPPAAGYPPSPQHQQAAGYPPTSGYPPMGGGQGYPHTDASYPPHQQQQQGGYPQHTGGGYPPPADAGYPPHGGGGGGYPPPQHQQAGYPPAHQQQQGGYLPAGGGYPQGPTPAGYPQQGGHVPSP